MAIVQAAFEKAQKHGIYQGDGQRSAGGRENRSVRREEAI